MDNTNWKEEYRKKYEGANAWSSSAIDSQVEDIQTLLSQKEEEMTIKFRQAVCEHSPMDENELCSKCGIDLTR